MTREIKTIYELTLENNNVLYRIRKREFVVLRLLIVIAVLTIEAYDYWRRKRKNDGTKLGNRTYFKYVEFKFGKKKKMRLT